MLGISTTLIVTISFFRFSITIYIVIHTGWQHDISPFLQVVTPFTHQTLLSCVLAPMCISVEVLPSSAVKSLKVSSLPQMSKILFKAAAVLCIPVVGC